MSDNDWRTPNPIPEPPAEATPPVPDSIKEKVEEAEVVTEPVKTPEVGTFKGLPVRVAGDKIWLLKSGKRQWITSKEVYESLGFRFGDEKPIDAETLMLIPEGTPLR